MEISDMVGGIFGSKAFELGNVGGKLGWHSRPTNIMLNRVINDLIEVGETEASHIREQRDSWGSSRGGSTSNSPSIRVGVAASVRP